ncbi:MAG: methyltransferase domain-containing protein [Ancrocorticia sp.]|uniref:methyltransferase domain-containing protein n=1 Tax=Ancrocorticia sp. TaxID=2593684 RepID=UPI003F9264CF
MQCDYFDAGVCRSCTFMGEPYSVQLARKQEEVAGLLEAWPTIEWLPAFASAESLFRNKAKLVVGGSPQAPTLGILDAQRKGVDLRECGLYEPRLADCFGVLSAFVTRAGLMPFDVPTGRGELKNIIVTVSPSGELMVRFVLRSTESLPRIRKHLSWLQSALPEARVVSVNLLPERKALPEGPEEIVLTEADALPMRMDSATLYLRPQSFFQTNTAVAQGLYALARNWVDGIASARNWSGGASESGGFRSPLKVWDLYCGVGGFALHCAGPQRDVLGVEISEQAVESARLGAVDLTEELASDRDRSEIWRDGSSMKSPPLRSNTTRAGTAEARGESPSLRFMAGDADSAVRAEGGSPDIVIVNPPRRGIGNLAEWIENSDAQWLIYSSCNAKSLAKDLGAMPGFIPTTARLFDMFPQTTHCETMVLAQRV